MKRTQKNYRRIFTAGSREAKKEQRMKSFKELSCIKR